MCILTPRCTVFTVQRGGGWIGQTHADEKIHPVVFWSRKLLPAEVNYPTHERELLAIVEMTKRFRHFLLGRTCFVHTDHKALEFLQTQPNLSVRQVNWVEHLQQFDLIIAYLAGPLNHLADYLSRRPDFSPKCPKCSTNMPIVTEIVNSAELLHPDILQQIRDFLAHNAFPKTAGSRETMKPHWSRRQGLLYYQDRLYVPDVPSMRQNLITDHHSNAQSGHLGFVKTLHRIREN